MVKLIRHGHADITRVHILVEYTPQQEKLQFQ